jgi:hypothetical protein
MRKWNAILVATLVCGVVLWAAVAAAAADAALHAPLNAKVAGPVEPVLLSGDVQVKGFIAADAKGGAKGSITCEFTGSGTGQVSHASYTVIGSDKAEVGTAGPLPSDAQAQCTALLIGPGRTPPQRLRAYVQLTLDGSGNATAAVVRSVAAVR